MLIVDPEQANREQLKKGLTAEFSLVEIASNAATADALLQHAGFDLIISDTRLSDRCGIAWVQQLRAQ